MTDMIFDFNFEGTYKVDEREFAPIVDFGLFQLAAKKNVTQFVSGAEIVIPSIQIDGKAWSRKGMKEGGKTEAFFFTRQAEKQDGTPFTEVRIFTTTPNIPVEIAKLEKYPVYSLNDYQLKQKEEGETTLWLSDWSNLQIPAIKADMKLAAIIGAGKPFYGSAKNWNTGKKPNIANEGTENEKKYYERFWYDFVMFSSKEEMIAARDAHFAALHEDTTVVMYPVSPVDWTGNEQMMKDWVKSELAAGKDLKATAATAGLIAGAKDKNGMDVDYKAILAEIIGIPVAMVQV